MRGHSTHPLRRFNQEFNDFEEIEFAQQMKKKKGSFNKLQFKKTGPKNILKRFPGKRTLQTRNNQSKIRTNLKVPEKTKDPKQKQEKYALQQF